MIHVWSTDFLNRFSGSIYLLYMSDPLISESFQWLHLSIIYPEVTHTFAACHLYQSPSRKQVTVVVFQRLGRASFMILADPWSSHSYYFQISFVLCGVGEHKCVSQPVWPCSAKDDDAVLQCPLFFQRGKEEKRLDSRGQWLLSQLSNEIINARL